MINKLNKVLIKLDKVIDRFVDYRHFRGHKEFEIKMINGRFTINKI